MRMQTAKETVDDIEYYKTNETYLLPRYIKATETYLTDEYYSDADIATIRAAIQGVL